MRRRNKNPKHLKQKKKKTSTKQQINLTSIHKLQIQKFKVPRKISLQNVQAFKAQILSV